MDDVQEAPWIRLNALRAERNAWYAAESIVILNAPRQAVVAAVVLAAEVATRVLCVLCLQDSTFLIS